VPAGRRKNEQLYSGPYVGTAATVSWRACELCACVRRTLDIAILALTLRVKINNNNNNDDDDDDDDDNTNNNNNNNNNVLLGVGSCLVMYMYEGTKIRCDVILRGTR